MRAMEFKTLFLYVAGLTLAFSYDDLSYNKNASQSRTYHDLSKYSASLAVDRDTSSCMRTSEIGLNSQSQTMWWKVDLGRVYSIHSVTIIFKTYEGYENRQRGRFAGFSLYVSNTDVSTISDIKNSTLCYKDGPQLPPLNFSCLCYEKGRYFIFYNERLYGIAYPSEYPLLIYTELCEVIVKGCDTPGVYGSNCDKFCPSNCAYNMCSIQHGRCFMCMSGWLGASCNIKCMEGWYGVNCSQQCNGHCRDGTICNHVTGQCDRGCDKGWTGSRCEKACDDGTFGYYCSGHCSGHCLNGSHCNKQSGHCDWGCNPGFTDFDCSKQCPSGYFGMACSARCIGYCSGYEPCDHVIGMCPGGCQEGYTGQYCNKSCAKGYYGRQCSSVCSPNCKTCQHTDGVCTCKAGWMGLNCTQECVSSFGENCQYPCSAHCINQTCDRFNGSCLFDCKETCDFENESWNLKTSHISSVKMVALIITPIMGIIIIVSLIILWKKLIQKKTCTNCVQRRSRLKTNLGEKNVTTDESHYQELGSLKEENTYQTLKTSVN